jgi:DNA repair protein RecN (Recombination protein N)
VDLHGQHETQSLLRGETQRDILDAFAGALSERHAVAAAHLALAALRKEEEELTARRDEVWRRADYLRHVVSEIDQAHLKAGEEEALAREAQRLSHSQALTENAQRIAQAIQDDDSGALPALASAERAFEALQRIDPVVAAWKDMLESAYANLSELARAAADYATDIPDDPTRLDEIERRRDRISRLTQKYGATVDAVLAMRRQSAAELELLDTADTDLRGLAARRHAAEAALRSAADGLSGKRREGANRLARPVNQLLHQVGLPGGRFEAVLEPLPAPGAAGQEAVSFTVRLNPGLDARPLARCASGGELSRIMLALKVVLARHDAVPVLIFDEIDQGIGGEVGTQLAGALARVAQGRQVLVITHLPQIAARADRHLVVSKGTRQGVAATEAHPIHGEDRIVELARMLGDADAATARRHAQAMLAQSAVSSER